jgi:hypothetical protein
MPKWRMVLTFPDLAVWDEKGRFAGWNFGLPVPGDDAWKPQN